VTVRLPQHNYRGFMPIEMRIVSTIISMLANRRSSKHPDRGFTPIEMRLANRRSAKHSDRGFTLIEMMVVLMIIGILAAIAAPSLLALNKPLRDATSEFQSQLSLIRTKAISSNRAYRIRPDTTNLQPGEKYHKFRVEYASNCRVTSGTTPGTTAWQAASQFDLSLPPEVGLDPTVTSVSTPSDPNTATVIDLNWSICFDNRGIVGGTVPNIVLRDFQDNNRAKIAAFITSTVGGTDIYTYDVSNTRLPDKTF
jgi:type II secretion system protein H